MEIHPKYTLQRDSNRTYPYVIMEHASLTPGGLSSKEYGRSGTLDDAMLMLSLLSNGPIVIAYSAQPIDNTFDVSRG